MIVVFIFLKNEENSNVYKLYYFNTEKQLLTIDIEPLVYHDSVDEYKNNLIESGYYNFSINSLSDDNENIAISLKTRFDGNKFIKP